MSEGFIKHLEHASSVVKSWPKWKQEVLGGTASDTSKDDTLWHYQCAHCGMKSGYAYRGCKSAAQEQAPGCCQGERMNVVLAYPKERKKEGVDG